MMTTEQTAEVLPVRLLLVDQQTIVRQGLRSLFQAHGVDVVGEAADGPTALALARELCPDVVVTEVSLGELGGAALTRQLRAGGVGAQVIALSGRADRSCVVQMLEAGAAGYVLKDDPFENLLEALDAVVRGHEYYSPKVAPIVAAHTEAENGEQEGCPEDLCERERDVLRLLAEGATIKEVAAALDVSAKTVETYRSRIMKKLDLSGIADLTRYAVREGLTRL